MTKKNALVSSWLMFFLIFVSVISVGLIINSGPVYAQNTADTLEGLNETAGKITAFSDQTETTYDSTFVATKAGQILGLVLSFIGILFLGLMIYAGLMWMTAAGNEQKIASSKELLINASIGLVIVFASYAITVFIGNQFLN